MRYPAKRQYTWSAKIAYCVGLIASDGCLSQDGRHIDLTSVDIEQLENFILCMERELRINSKANNSIVPAFRVQFSDVAFYDFLLKAGLTPRKSHTIGHVKVPDTYYFDFLRGVFDGDGCVYGYRDKRWANSHMFYVEFSSASTEFLFFLQSKNIDLAHVTLGAIKQVRGANVLSYAKTDGLLLANRMYYRNNLPSLSRKRVKLFDFIKLHQDAIIARNARVVKSVNTYA